MAEFDEQAALAAGYDPQTVQKIKEGVAAAKAQGYGDDEIKRFVVQKYGTPGQTPAATPTPAAAAPAAAGGQSTFGYLGHLAGLGGQAIAEGIGDVAGMPGTLASLGQEYVMRPAVGAVSNALGIAPPPEAAWGHPEQLSGPSINAAGAKLWQGAGLPTPAGAQTPGEERFAATMRGLPTSALGIATGMGPVAALVSGAGGSLANELGGEVFGKDTAGAWLPGLALGGVAAGGESIANAQNLRNAAESALEQAKASHTALTGSAAGQSARDLELSTAAAKDASQAQLTANLANAQGAHALTHIGADTTIESTAADLGEAKTVQEGGAALQDRARAWVTGKDQAGNPIEGGGMPGKLAGLWAPVDALIPSTTPVELKAFQGALGEINKSAGELEPLAAIFKSSAPKQIQATLDRLLEGKPPQLGPSGEILTPGVAPVQPTWGDVQRLRTVLGDALANPKVLSDVGNQNLQHLYATLTQDMSRTAEGAGALDAFRAANEQSTKLYTLAGGPVNKVITAPKNINQETITPEQAATAALARSTKGGSVLEELRSEPLLSQGVDELAAGQLRSNPDLWSKLSPEAKDALAGTPERRAALDSAYGLKDQADAELARRVSEEAMAHKQRVKAIDDVAGEASFNASQGAKLAKEHLDAAQDAVNALKPQGHGIVRDIGLAGAGGAMERFGSGMIENLLTGAGGDTALGTMLHPLVSGAALGAAAAAAPLAWRMSKAVVKNPLLLRGPLMGATSGQQALTGQPQP